MAATSPTIIEVVVDELCMITVTKMPIRIGRMSQNYSTKICSFWQLSSEFTSNLSWAQQWDF